MTPSYTLVLPTAFLALSYSTWAAQLPYNPTSLIRGPNDTIYALLPNSQPQFLKIDVSRQVLSSNPGISLANTLPFLTNSSIAFTSSIGSDGITVVTGDCSQNGLGIWKYSWQENTAAWIQYGATEADSSLSANYLSSAFTFSPTNASQNAITYVFGGMCPLPDVDITSWTANATYSNTMLTVTPAQGQDYQLAMTGQRAPPIAEAGLTMTSLIPSVQSSSSGMSTMQQNFVLVGGHTETAFINMSQVALFSLPEQSWAFLRVDQSPAVTVEPRSGHTAVLTEDGSQIIVLGGWVGDVTRPATPQLAIINTGQGYGGNGSWSWSVPQQSSSPYTSSQGIFGHGAVMLPGDVMMVAGGFPISASGNKLRRDNSNFKFYNVKSGEWLSSYSGAANVVQSKPSGLTNTAKAGIGAGIGLALAAVVVIVAVWFLYARHKKLLRQEREKELRAMALGGGKSCSNANLAVAGMQEVGRYPEMRSASWGNRQEQMIGADVNEKSLFGGGRPSGFNRFGGHAVITDDRTGPAFNVPNPNIVQRQSLRSRGPIGLNTNAPGSLMLNSVFTINEEEEERSNQGSVKRQKLIPPERPLSNPFKDSYEVEPQDEAAFQRRKEVETWVEDWASAAESMNLSRANSKATGRTYSNLSAHHTNSGGSTEGRSSPDKSDRSGSNLSERSNRPAVHRTPSTAGGIARTFSQRSTSAGHALFLNAASAMARLTGTTVASNNTHRDTTDLDRSASKRSLSTGDLSKLAARKRSNSTEQSPTKALPSPAVRYATTREREYADYYTPPESPVKEYKGSSHNRSSSLTSQSRKALSVLSNATKRVFTGTGYVDVQGRVSTIEDSQVSPTKPPPPERMITTDFLSTAGHSTSTQFWKQRQGPHDWEDSHHDSNNLHPQSAQAANSSLVRRNSGRHHHHHAAIDVADDAASVTSADWDVETAVQQRVVQVMFTVPKEKLRVVNADSVSMISRSETNASREDNTAHLDITPPTSPPRVHTIVTTRRSTSGGGGSASRVPSGLWLSSMAEEQEPVQALDLSRLSVPDLKGKGKEGDLRYQRSGESIGKAM